MPSTPFLAHWTWAQKLTASAGAYVFVSAGLALLGWVADVPSLTIWDLSGDIAIQPNAALSVLLSGAALIATACGCIKLSRFMALLVGTLAGATLFENLSGIDLGIDTLLLFDRTWGLTATVSPGRMGIPASLSLTLIGLTMTLVPPGSKNRRAVPLVGISIMTLTLLSIIGYIFGATAFFSAPGLTAIALQTAIMLFIIGAGLIASAPEHQPMRQLVEKSAAGMLLRRALPFAFMLPISVAWLRVKGEEMGLYDLLFGRALLVLMLTITLVALLWYCVRAVRAHEREQIRSEERFARFMQSLPGLAWIKDIHGHYIYANEPALRAFNLSRAELYGKTDEQVFPPHTAAVFRENDERAFKSGSGIRTIETLKHEDGVPHHSIVSKFIIPDHDGMAVMVGGIAIDITERIEAEAALREADRRKDEFLATLAHELRNPLAPVRNGLEILKRAGNNNEMSENVRGMMERQVTHMVRLIDDLMDISRITRGKLALRNDRVDMVSVARHAVESASAACAQKSHQLKTDFPPEPLYVFGDVVRLEQVVGNLLNNACKYTNPGGIISISVQREGQEVVVRVKDNGIGIAPEMLPRVFEIFTQAPRSREHVGSGLGIGLSLVNALTELHGGRVEAMSAGLDKGSEFAVYLPERAEVMALQQDMAFVRPSGRPRRILVVDDNLDAANSLKMLLQMQGHNVQTAADGEEGVAKAVEFRPEIILLDIGMPKMDGYEACRLIREQLGNLPHIVALTGWGQEADRRKSSVAGFDAHLVKPVDNTILTEMIASLSAARTSI